jgi:hypothetical protein
MRCSIFFLTILLTARPLNAQWRDITDFIGMNDLNQPVGEDISCVYFSPSTLGVGFVGTDGGLWKTTNMGQSWVLVRGDGYSYSNYYVTGICFKDSKTGWMSVFGYTDACYRTTDGGNNWTELNVPDSDYGAISIYYCSKTNRLLLGMGDTGTQVSTDLGNTWHLLTTVEAGGFSFSNDSVGIGAAYPTDSTTGMIQTTNGGITWRVVDTLINCEQPLAIQGSPVCFEAGRGRIIIRRSDDYGETWRIIKDFGPFQDSMNNTTAPYGTGFIKGDLSRLYIQTDSGMYVSTDEGVSWKNDGGPMYLTNFSNDCFYSANGITIAGMTYGNGTLYDGGLWEEDWPQSLSVAEQEPTPTQSGPLEVFDLLGRCVYRGPAEKLPILSAGAYILRTGEKVEKVFVP